MSEPTTPPLRARSRRRGGVGLGRTQVLVLRLLASGPKSVRTLSYDWPDLTESAARSAVNRLGDRGLVDMAGWDRNDGRTFCLTARGREVEAALNVDGQGQQQPGGEA